jgi:hypothetical protein
MQGSLKCIYDILDEYPETCKFAQKTTGTTKDWYFCEASKYFRKKCKEQGVKSK